MFTLKGIFSEENVFIKLFFTITIAFIGLIIVTAVAIQLTKFDFPLNDPTISRIISVIQSVCVFIVPAFMMAYLTSKQPLRFLSIKEKPLAKDIIIVILFMISAISVINFLAEFNAQMKLPECMSGIEKWMQENEESRRIFSEKLLTTSSFGILFVNIIVVALLPALGEELLFRGILQSYFSSWLKNPHLGIWITAFVFSAIHIQFYGFIPRLLLGAYFGYLLLWSKSIWLPVIAHFINNCIIVVCYFLYKNAYINFNIDEISITWYVTLASFIILCGLLAVQIKRQYKKECKLP
jgi:membrane protease YdiL (CAAX protease family)